jgi:hypothetical protein
MTVAVQHSTKTYLPRTILTWLVLREKNIALVLAAYLHYLCLMTYSGVQHILCCIFLFCVSSSCVPYVASFSGLSIFVLPLRYSITFSKRNTSHLTIDICNQDLY